MESIRSDRTEAFVELFALHQRRLYGFIYTMVPNRADAEDLLSQTSLVLWRKFDTFQPGSDFGAWSCRIAHLEALNFLKQKRRSRVHFSEELVAKLAEVRTARSTVHFAYEAALIDCIAKLSESDRQLIRLCYETKQSIKEAAEELGRPAASVYASLSRIRRVLLGCIRQSAGEEDIR